MQRVLGLGFSILFGLLLFTTGLAAQAPVQLNTCADIGSPPRTECSNVFANQFAPTFTVQAAAYASGNCIGGFTAITVASVAGQGGVVTNFRVSSFGGSTPTITVYLFDSLPSASTCTDRSTFTLAAADVSRLIASPTAITLAAPTGTTVTFGSVDYTPPRPFAAGGSSISVLKTVYVALVSGSTFTPGSTTDLVPRIGVVLF